MISPRPAPFHPSPRCGGGEPPVAGKLAQPTQAWLRRRGRGRSEERTKRLPPPAALRATPSPASGGGMGRGRVAPRNEAPP
jgi:hypothetical protein